MAPSLVTSSWPEVLLWSVFATGLLSIVLVAAQGLGGTRLSLPFLVGTALTGRRHLAMTLGTGLHLLAGCAFGLIYALVFEAWAWGATWWSGALLGAAHTAVVLLVLQLSPWLHPRVARVREGPTRRRRIEPPGALALRYGPATPVVVLAAHLVYGVVLGSFYPG